ncbi:MAG: metallophosphoesterase [Bdellovibrionales bacterium]|nr:metallophosphoesterase [Bdellovibrionales bacterium]
MLLRHLLFATLVSVTLTGPFAFAQDLGPDIFRVAPYTLRHTNGHLLLNLQLNTDKNLIIEDDAVHTSELYRKNQHYQIQLGVNDCGTSKDLRIKDATNNEVIYANSFPAFKCASTSRDEEFTFGFISDTQQYTERHEKVAKVIAYHHALDPLMFLINGGDIVQNGYSENEWLQYFKGGSSYLLDIPQIAAIGNHDYIKGKEKLNFQAEVPPFFQKYLRWDGTASDGNLFFQMPGFNLVIWNSNTPELKRKEEKEMRRWLEAKLLASQKAKIPVILATHFPVYTSSLSRFVNTQVMKMRKYMPPLFEAYGVKLVLSGHTHLFERSFKDGINYLVAGPAGGRPSVGSIKNKYRQKIDEKALTFTKIHYKNKSFRVETYNEDNELIDQLYVNY